MAAVAAAPRPQLSPLSGGGGATISSLTLQTLAFISPLPTRRRRRCVLRSNASSSPSPPPSQEKEAAAEVVPTAESCVNLGLQLFSKGRVSEARRRGAVMHSCSDTPRLALGFSHFES